MSSTPSTRTAPRPGHTLLELVVATVLLGATLTPALRLMREGLRLGREIEAAGVLNTLCVSKLEQHMVHGAAEWTNTVSAGDFSGDGFNLLRYQVTRSDLPAAGGLADRLMTITATTWEDANGNAAWDEGELRVVYATKIANMAVYQDVAEGA